MRFTERPFVRRYPALTGMLLVIGPLVGAVIIMPPLLWLAGGVLLPVARALRWWIALWQ